MPVQGGHLHAAWILLAIVSLLACSMACSAPVNPCVPNGPGIPAYFGTFPNASNSANYPARLSQTGAFTPTANLTPAATLVPYDVNTPLWSDAAMKQRWFGIPQNTQITFNANGEWGFPNGTVFVKHFDLETNEITHAKRRLETRFIITIPGPEKVYGLTYRWDPANANDAFLVGPDGADDDIIITGPAGNRTQRWRYPSQAQCLECHTPNTCGVLGVNTRQMNRTYSYGPGCPPVNQIQTLQFLGYFNNIVPPPASLPALASITNTSVDMMRRFRSYMDANCAHCHRPGGSGAAFFDARYDVAPTDMLGSQIIFGDCTNSKIFTLDSAVVEGGGIGQMPPLAKRLVDTNWIAFLKEFITNSFNPLAGSVCVPNNNQTVIRFNRPVDPTSGANVNNYTLDGYTITGATVAGDTVTLAVDPAFANDAGEQTLTISNVRDQLTPPNTNWPGFELKFTPSASLNDAFANATDLGNAHETNVFAVNVCATKEAGEPNHAANPGGKSLWWTWTAPADCFLNLNTEGATFDTVLGLYTGDSADALTVIAANDDAQPPERWSSLSAPVQAGVAYRIAVDGYNGASGQTSLNLEFHEFLDPLNLSIVILTPADGAVIPSGPNVYLNAWVDAPPGALARVEYFGDSSWLGTDTSGNSSSSAFWPFVSPGPHTLVAVATATNGLLASHEIHFTATFEPGTNQPPANLTPFLPLDWSDPIVVSTTTGTTTDSSSLTTADMLYVDWAVINNGTGPTGARFDTELYVDDVLQTSWYSDPPLSPMFYAYVSDYSIGTLSAGDHTLRIRTDSSSVIAESNEADNEYTRIITVAEESGASNAAPVAVSDSFSVEAGTSTPLFVLGNDYDPDSDPIFIASYTQPSFGAVPFRFEGQLVYQSDPGFTGTDLFTYTISDGRGGTSTTTVYVTVTNRPPSYSISGFVTDTNGFGVANVAMNLTGDQTDTVSTDFSGFYVIADLPAGNYLLTPSLVGYRFSPMDISYTPLGTDAVDSFTAIPTNEPMPIVQFSHIDFVILEDFGLASVGVERTGDLSLPVTVSWSIQAGTATLDSDYALLTPSGQLTFAPGETTQSILVDVIDDAEVEQTEWFSFSLHDPTNAVLGSIPSMTLNILDNDANPSELPTLNLACWGENFIVTWPARFDGFFLEATDSLTPPPAQWRPLSFPVDTVGSQNQVVLPKQGEKLFFRLAQAAAVPAADVDIDVDTDRSGAIEDEPDEKDEDQPVKFLQDVGALVLVNCDADRTDRQAGDGKRDMDDRVISGADDEADMSPIGLELKRDLAQDEILVLKLLAIDTTGKADPKALPAIRLMDKKAGKTGQALFADGGGSRIDEFPLPDGTKLFPGRKKQRYDGRFLLEGFRFATEVELRLVIFNTKTKKAVAQDVVRVVTTPWLANHHKQPLADPNAWQISGNLLNSQSYAFANDYGAKRVEAGDELEFVQDSAEWGYQVRRQKPAENSRTMIVALRLYTEREDKHPLKFAGPKVGVFGWHANDEKYYEDRGDRKAGDQGGNLECLPPSDKYPYGRITHGDFMSAKLKAFLQRQGVQYGLELKLTDLHLPHVDEMIVIVPKKEGWVVVMPDWDEGRKILVAADPQVEVIPLRILVGERRDKVLKTYGEILDYIDNQDEGKKWAKLYREGMAAIEKQLKDEGIQVLRLPSMFFVTALGGENLRGWPRNVANCQVVNPKADDPGTLIVSQPPKRENDTEDPFLTEWKIIFEREKITIGFEDMTEAWKRGGEAHCSSNAIREPVKQ